MVKKRKKQKKHRGLQAVTLCISTAMVLVLLGMVVFSVLTARNLSEYIRENYDEAGDANTDKGAR